MNEMHRLDYAKKLKEMFLELRHDSGAVNVWVTKGEFQMIINVSSLLRCIVVKSSPVALKSVAFFEECMIMPIFRKFEAEHDLKCEVIPCDSNYLEKLLYGNRWGVSYIPDRILLVKIEGEKIRGEVSGSLSGIL